MAVALVAIVLGADNLVGGSAAIARRFGISDFMIDNMQSQKLGVAELRHALDCEIEINNMRNNLREEEILRIENNASEYHSSVYYIDIISEIERMGDFIINISEALQPKR